MLSKPPPKPSDFLVDVDHTALDLKSFKNKRKADIKAIKALSNGHATDVQQKRALSFIIKYLCRTDLINYFPEDERGTCFALGREAVGKFLRGLALDSDYLDEDNL